MNHNSKKKGQKEISGDLNHYAEPIRNLSKLKITSHRQAAKYLYFVTVDSTEEIFIMSLGKRYNG